MIFLYLEANKRFIVWIDALREAKSCVPYYRPITINNGTKPKFIIS